MGKIFAAVLAKMFTTRHREAHLNGIVQMFLFLLAIAIFASWLTGASPLTVVAGILLLFYGLAYIQQPVSDTDSNPHPPDRQSAIDGHDTANSPPASAAASRLLSGGA